MALQHKNTYFYWPEGGLKKIKKSGDAGGRNFHSDGYQRLVSYEGLGSGPFPDFRITYHPNGNRIQLFECGLNADEEECLDSPDFVQTHEFDHRDRLIYIRTKKEGDIARTYYAYDDSGRRVWRKHRDASGADVKVFSYFGSKTDRRARA